MDFDRTTIEELVESHRDDLEKIASGDGPAAWGATGLLEAYGTGGDDA